ncbi:hypothetical protein ACFYRC_28575 [Streptomyces sp. NPDC005279]|uniref:hypothetical protein n=1 Tax=Streptomyces sp. NPDC005279 TaxID=3364712 RepID=UPI0036A252F4
MNDQEPRSQPQPMQDYEAELAAFAERLRELRLGCGAPSFRTIAKAANGGLPISTVSEVFRAKRLPKPDFLILLVQVLYEHVDGRPVGDRDPRVQRWRKHWLDVKRLEDDHRRVRRETGHAAPRRAREDRHALPPSDATIPQLEAAREGLQDFLADIAERQRQASKELLLAFEERVKVEDDIERLKREEARQHKQALQGKIAALEQQRAELSRHIAHLRQELDELQDDQLDITEEESELNDRRAELYFAWARSEEAKLKTTTRPLADHIKQLSAQLADRDQKLAAADQLIAGLRDRV